MRERLRSESLTSSTPPGRSRASSQATHESSRLSMTSSNTSSDTSTETVVDDSPEEQHYERPSQTRRLSSGVLARLEEQPDLPMEHAWDSVVRHFLFSS